MKTYQLGKDHRITVTETASGFNVQFYELTAARWIPLGQPESWGCLDDILTEYGIN